LCSAIASAGRATYEAKLTWEAAWTTLEGLL
jgi:hypothetical protein